MTITTIRPASVGRIVHVIGKGAESNGALVAPAIVTRVWGAPGENGKQMLNVTMFPDNAEPKPQGSVFLYPSLQAAHDAVSGVTGVDSVAAYWPDQV